MIILSSLFSWVCSLQRSVLGYSAGRTPEVEEVAGGEERCSDIPLRERFFESGGAAHLRLIGNKACKAWHPDETTLFTPNTPAPPHPAGFGFRFRI